MNKARLQIIAVVAIFLFVGGMLYLRMGPGSRGDIPQEARKIIQTADDNADFEAGGSAAIAERTGGTKPSESGARLSSEGNGDLQNADSSDDDPQISSKKKSSARRKKGRKGRSDDDATEEEDARKPGKKVTPSKTIS